MRIVTARRLSQVFFFSIFIWLCIVTTQGTQWCQLRGWPVNLILQLDPLVAIGTVLSTHTLYAPLLWALLTVVLTIVFGRFFCGWLCPFGSLHQFAGFLGNRKKPTAKRVQLNKYRKAQCIKYFLLIFFLVSAALPMAGWASLQSGLLDPIPLVTRSINLTLLPIIDSLTNTISATPRYYEGAWLLLAVFFAAIFLNLLIPRFYCRFVCPLGALFAILSRFLCFNCLDGCKDDAISYQTVPSLAGEVTNPDISRRGFILSMASGVFAVPAVRLAGKLATNWPHKLIRPPGALSEAEFLKRCIKCGQCMRICPTNVLQPAGMEMALEALWTPILNNRIGTSGCQLNCTACGYICPTSAIRPITLPEKLGLSEFAEVGPIRIGTAFVDRSRCLPWAMDKPCIVCEENCPLSPKAIYTQVVFNTVRDGILTVKKISANTIETVEKIMQSDKFATGDYYCSAGDGKRVKITANTENFIEISSDGQFGKNLAQGGKIEVQRGE
jgi:polyferredoxin